ncbi:MAG: hypothetical protein P8188_14850 [Gemmatimonadota bacterium]|jgi:hypothetical protein
MGDRLKAGGLGSKSDTSDVPGAFSDSMAKAMEDALNLLLSAEGRARVPVDNTPESRDRRMMFVAIARGVVNHLVANADAFDVKRNDGTTVADRRITIRI